jgi:hypothetical protein
MTDLPCLSIMCPEGLEEVLGSAGEGRPLPFSRRTGSPAQAGSAGRLARDEADAAARTFGVARGTVARWVGQYHQGGEAALDQRPQGRPPAPKLTGEQQKAIVGLIEGHCPDQLGLPAFLWTRETVATLIKKRFGLALSVWTVGR